jgi:adenylate kinase
MTPSRPLLDLAAAQWWRLALRSATTTSTSSSSSTARAGLSSAASARPSSQAAAPARAFSTKSSSTNSTASTPPTPPPPSQARWVFLGPPGVGKGTYASRVAAALGVQHVAAGDLVRAEIKAGTPLGLQAREAVAAGRLLPDALVLALVRDRLEALAPGGYLLDGFPRTRAQAEALFGGDKDGNNNSHLPTLAVNLSLREEVLVDKCVGRRVCGRCGKGFNVADIHLEADGSSPEIVMPPLNPPPECASYMETREDDTEPVVRRRLAAYRAEAGPVEAFFEARGMLLNFEITGGIPQTLPRLARALKPYHNGDEGLIGGGGSGGGGGAVVDKNKRDKAKCGLEAAAAAGSGGGGGASAAGAASAASTAQQQQKQACG